MNETRKRLLLLLPQPPPLALFACAKPSARTSVRLSAVLASTGFPVERRCGLLRRRRPLRAPMDGLVYLP